MAKRYSRTFAPPGPVDEPAVLLRTARKLVGEEADPFFVSDALFKAAFTSLVRLPGEDDRRHRILSQVHERAYELLANGIDIGAGLAVATAAAAPAPLRLPVLAHRP